MAGNAGEDEEDEEPGVKQKLEISEAEAAITEDAIDFLFCVPRAFKRAGSHRGERRWKALEKMRAMELVLFIRPFLSFFGQKLKTGTGRVVKKKIAFIPGAEREKIFQFPRDEKLNAAGYFLLRPP
ncbi:hypothetical protein RUM43_007711 [Polyplax serrata]|uniref:Uncharacterized protein n=1 Tax=Polyplax serrata TaxID=468196 RepID=A0AAN8S1X3_POLSC